MMTSKSQWKEKEDRSDALIDRLDAFMAKMEMITTRLEATLDERERPDAAGS